MPTIKDALGVIGKLIPVEQEELKTMLLSSTFVSTFDIEDFVCKERFSNGRVCLLCGCIHAVRMGVNGVYAKHLNNYLVWNNLVNYAKKTDTDKRNIFLSFVLATFKSAKCRDMSNRPAVPLAA